MGWGEWAALATITTAAAGGAIFIVKVIIPYLRKIGRIIDRIGRVDADPKSGQSRIPSIFEALDELKERMDGQDKVLETIRHEVEYNNGTSIKDSQRRQETDTRDLKNSFDDLKKAFEDHTSAPTTTVNNKQGG